MERRFSIKVPLENTQKRIDKFLSNENLDLSRTQFYKYIKSGLITVNGINVKPSHKLKTDEVINVHIPNTQKPSIAPENIPIEIIYEDDSLIVVNKSAGMVVHPAAGNPCGTLVNALLYHCDNLAGIGGIERPGIVHRLDKYTSGLLVVAKDDLSHQSLSKQFQERSVNKIYIAIVCKKVKQLTGLISVPIGRHRIDRKKMSVNYNNGKEATTSYRVLERFEKYTFVELKLYSGRTHQIRVHLAFLGNPVVGDDLYGYKKGWGGFITRQALHAMTLGFNHPKTGKLLEFSSNLPVDFLAALDHLRA